MARTFTLSSVRDQTRARADMQSTSSQSFIPDAELNKYINQSLTELYDMLVSSGGQEYYESSSTFTTALNTDTYSLPSDFYRLLGVDVLINGTVPGQAVTLQPYMFNERNSYNNLYGGIYGTYYCMKYRISGGLNIRFIPVPFPNLTVKIWYIPVCATLVADGDTFDGVDGFEELVVVDAAIKCLQKEESDVSVLMARKAELVARISAMSPYRDASAAERVRDVDVELLTTWPWGSG